MKITIDASSLLLRSAGIKSYTFHWIQAMRKLAGFQSVQAFPFLGKLGELDHDRSLLPPHATYPRLAALYAANLLPGAVDWFVGNSDLFHASNQVRRAPRKTRLTATVHDLTCWKLPELHTAANVRADRHFAEQILQKAD